MTYFFMMAILLNILPGPAMFYVMHHSIEKNRLRTILSLLGVECGTFIHTLAATFGLTVLLIQFPFLLDCAKYLSAVFLIYLGLSAFMKNSKFRKGILPETGNASIIFLKGVVINFLNPKVLLFFTVILPQCMIIDAPDAQYHIFILGVLFCIFGICIRGMASIALFSSSPTQGTNFSAKIFWIDKLINSLFIVFGIGLLTWSN